LFKPILVGAIAIVADRGGGRETKEEMKNGHPASGCPLFVVIGY